jgi:hypothetical protein
MYPGSNIITHLNTNNHFSRQPKVKEFSIQDVAGGLSVLVVAGAEVSVVSVGIAGGAEVSVLLSSARIPNHFSTNLEWAPKFIVASKASLVDKNKHLD